MCRIPARISQVTADYLGSVEVRISEYAALRRRHVSGTTIEGHFIGSALSRSCALLPSVLAGGISTPAAINAQQFEWLGTAYGDANDLLDALNMSDPSAAPFPPKLRRSTSLICDINGS